MHRMYDSSHVYMHINSIERVQHHFAKRITEWRNFSYRERLSILNFDTLEYRRLACDLTICTIKYLII